MHIGKPYKAIQFVLMHINSQVEHSAHQIKYCLRLCFMGNITLKEWSQDKNSTKLCLVLSFCLFISCIVPGVHWI